MGSSIRFGAPPPDLVVARKIPKAGSGIYAKHAFTVVRARVSGRWTLGVLREWMHGGPDGWCIRIETADPGLPGAAWSEWYVFRPESVDPLVVDAVTGEVRLTPPELRGGVGTRRESGWRKT